MVGEIETSPIITRLKFLVDDSGYKQLIEKVTQYQKIVEGLGKPTAKFTEQITRREQFIPEGTVITETLNNAILPVKNLEDRLDSLSGAFRGSTQALVATDTEFNNLYGNLLNTDQAGTRTIVTMERIGQTTYITTKIVDQFNQTISTSTREMTQGWQRFQFWSLGLMFFGMQLQRTFGKMWTSMNTAYTKITGNTTALGQANLRLSASMTFLQVSIMTALEPALLPLIEAIIDLVNWFSELDPVILQVAGLLVAGGALTGGILFTTGSIKTFVDNTLPQLILALTGPKGVAQAATTAGTTIGSSLSITTLGIAAIALLAILDIIRHGWDEFELAIKAHSLAIKYAAVQNWTQMGIALEIQNKETIQGLLIGWMGLSVDIWNILLELGKGILKVWEWLNPKMAPLVETMVKTFTEIQQNAFIKLAQIKADASKSIITDIINEMGPTKDLAQVLVDMGYKYDDIKIAIDASSLSHEQATAFLKLYSETLATTLRGITDINVALTTSASNYSVNVQGIQTIIDKNSELITSNNAVADSYSKLPYGAIGIHMTAQGSEYIYETPTVTTPTTAKTYSWNNMIGMAQGGIITQPTITKIGEGYQPEAIIPLNRLNKMNLQNSPPSINVGDINIDITTGPVSDNIDVKDLANKVSEEIMKDIRNYTKYVPQW